MVVENSVVVDLPPLVLHSGVRAHEMGWGSDRMVIDVIAQVCLGFGLLPQV